MAHRPLEAGLSNAPASTANPAAELAMPFMPQQQNSLPDPNGWNRKDVFTKQALPEEYSKHSVISPQSTFELKSGTLLPCVLISGLNSDLPGNITAQVSENVFDTATGRYLLIPAALGSSVLTTIRFPTVKAGFSSCGAGSFSRTALASFSIISRARISRAIRASKEQLIVIGVLSSLLLSLSLYSARAWKLSLLVTTIKETLMTLALYSLRMPLLPSPTLSLRLSKEKPTVSLLSKLSPVTGS